MSKSKRDKQTEREHTKLVNFSCRAPEAKAVFVAGTFNDWRVDAAPVKRGSDGQWRATLQLPPGHHEFKFVVDGQWCCEPGVKEESQNGSACCPNSFGTMNRVLEV